MFVKETWHILVTWSAGLTKLMTFFQGFGSLVSLQFQKDGGAKSKHVRRNVSASRLNTNGSKNLMGDKMFSFAQSNCKA